MNKNKKKIAIVGAGIFGCTIALILSKRFQVDLYERKPDILNEASKCNQFRYHYGFHYPRSKKTIDEIKKSNKDFIKFYGNKIFGKTSNYYGVVKKGGKTNFKKYINFLKRNKLKYKLIKESNLTSNKVEKSIISNEKILNYFKFKNEILRKLKSSTVNVKLSSQLDQNNLRYQNYYKVIVATYKNNNYVLKKLGKHTFNKFRYELVEKIAIKLPNKYRHISYVILDGNFVCLDPYLGTPYHLLSDVKYSKIKIEKKKFVKFSKKYDLPLIKTKNTNVKLTNFKKFIKSGQEYLPFLKFAKYIFSFYVVRTVKYNVEKTDERTNLINKVDNKIITVLSGKWNTCVYAAKKINKII